MENGRMNSRWKLGLVVMVAFAVTPREKCDRLWANEPASRLWANAPPLRQEAAAESGASATTKGTATAAEPQATPPILLTSSIERSAVNAHRAIPMNLGPDSHSSRRVDRDGQPPQDFLSAINVQPVSLASTQTEGQQVSPEIVPTPDVSFGEADVKCAPDCVDHGHCGWLWILGVEETFVVPNRDGTFSSVSVTTPFETFGATADDQMEFGSRLWFGMQFPCWQILTRLWFLDGVDNDHDPLLLGADRRSTITDSNVQVFSLDVEARRTFCGADGWNHYIGFGYRFSHLEDVAHVTAIGLDTTNAIPAIVTADAFGRSKIDGSGISVPFGATRPLHCGCCSQLDFFYNLRGSIVWGNIESSAITAVTVNDPNIPGVANRLDAAAAAQNGEVTIGEVQIGLRWTHELTCAPGVAFCQGAFEYQRWDVAGGLAQSTSTALINANQGTAVSFSGPNNEIEFIGFSIGLGMVW
jgi:hypothetical protein